jgi:hypothetical protein
VLDIAAGHGMFGIAIRYSELVAVNHNPDSHAIKLRD